MLRPLFRPLIASALLVSATACREITTVENEAVDESDLTFVRVDPEAPPLDATEVSFWAVQGEERQVQISYSSTEYGNGKCLLFRVPADAVMLGVAPGDSVLITIRVMDEAQFRFSFEPEGLQFDPAHPAELEIRYRWADADIDGDGDVDPRDALLAETFSLWEKVGTGTAWQRVSGAERRRESFEIVAPVVGFTQYALATD